MGDGSLLGPIIGAAGSVVGAGVNAFSQGSMNRATRNWSKDMYNLQRTNALADWNMQNAYNSPAQQMARLKAAGLNPNLVYGNGATMTSQPVRSVDTPQWHPTAPQIDPQALGGGLQRFYNLELQKNNVANLSLNNEILRQKLRVETARANNIEQNTQSSAFSLGVNRELHDTTIAQAKSNLDLTNANVQKTNVGIDFTMDENNRQNLQSANNFNLGIQSILNSEKQRQVSDANINHINKMIDILDKDGQIKDFEIALNKSGITKTDPAYYKIGTLFIDWLKNLALPQNKEAAKQGAAAAWQYLFDLKKNPFFH